VRPRLVYFWLLLVDRFELAMVVDEVCAAAVNVAFVPAMRSLGGGAPARGACLQAGGGAECA